MTNFFERMKSRQTKYKTKLLAVFERQDERKGWLLPRILARENQSSGSRRLGSFRTNTILRLVGTSIISVSSLLAMSCTKDYPPEITSYQMPAETTVGREFEVAAKAMDDKGIKEVYIAKEDGTKVATLIKSNSEYKARLTLPNEGEYQLSTIAKDIKDQQAIVKSKLLVMPIIPLVNVKGMVFHDYNANGVKENNEPVVPGVELAFFDNKENKNGNYPLTPRIFYGIIRV